MVQGASGPLVTPDELAEAFARSGLEGRVVLVHASLSRLGYVVGGAEAMLRALLDAAGPGGTIMAPAQTWLNLDPSRGVHGVPPEEWPTLRAHLPGFDPATTPSVGMGALAESVRTWPGAARSHHPVRSWAAVGVRATEIVAEHDLEDVHGERSPLGSAYRADARVALIGVGYDKCTALHLAETRSAHASKRWEAETSWVREGTARYELRYRNQVFEDHDFERIGAAFEATGAVRIERIGNGELRTFDLRVLVDFASAWMGAQRQ